MKNYERDVNYEAFFDDVKNIHKIYMYSPIVFVLHLFLAPASLGEDGISLFGACYFLYFVFYAFRWLLWTYAMYFYKDKGKEIKKIDWNEYNKASRKREEKIVREYGTLDYQREHYDCYKGWREKHHK